MEKSFINHAPNGVTFPVVTQHQASDTASPQHKGQHEGKGDGMGGRKRWCSYQVTVEDEAPAKLQTPKVFLVGLKISPHLPCPLVTPSPFIRL